jgi:hypothetical protein
MTQAPTITPEYAELNRRLHDKNVKYGSGAHRKVDAVLELMGEHDAENVLDYGCGKGTLAAALPGIDIREYDPAIPGKDEAPQPADIVVCLDVLEHVEPDLLDNVLTDIQRLARKAVLLTIATRPSTQTLADGRNAHLIQEDAAWWRARLAPLFEITAELVQEGFEYCVAARPLHEIGQIKSVMAVSSVDRQAQVEENCRRVSARLLPHGVHPVHGRKAQVLCYGPSLVDTIVDAITTSEEPGVDTFTVSAAHGFAIDRGIIPYAHMDCDPRRHKVTQMGQAHPRVRYWLASCVHPSYLDHVDIGREVSLWHAYNGEDSAQHIARFEPGSFMVVGGGSVGLRSLSLLYAMGYRSFQIHGMDSSFRGEAQWAGEHHGKRKPEVQVTMPDGRKFLTSPALILYYRYFFKQLYWMPDATVELHGDGMLQHAMRIANGTN